MRTLEKVLSEPISKPREFLTDEERKKYKKVKIKRGLFSTEIEVETR